MLCIMAVVISLLLFPTASFAGQQEAPSVRDAIQSMKDEVARFVPKATEK